MHCSSAARNTSNFNFSCRNSPLKIKAQVVWADCPVVISLFVTDCHASDSNTIILYFKTAAVHSRGVAVLSYENMKRTAGGKLLSRLETSPAHSVPLETAAASHSGHHKTGVKLSATNFSSLTPLIITLILNLIRLWQQIRTAVRRWVDLSSNHWPPDSSSDMSWAPPDSDLHNSKVGF